MKKEDINKTQKPFNTVATRLRSTKHRQPATQKAGVLVWRGVLWPDRQLDLSTTISERTSVSSEKRDPNTQ
jgi:hypothetical protein